MSNKYRDDTIHTNVMLVELNISQWTARKQDKRVSQAVAASNHVDEGVGNYYKSLLDPTILKDIKQCINETRSKYYKLTLPWADDGPRVLSAAMYFEFMAEMQAQRVKFEALVNEFLQDYPFHREEAKRFLGSLFREEDYPEPMSLTHKFSFNLSVRPLPKAGDFRVDIGDEELDRVRKQIEAETSATMERSVQETYTRIKEIAERYVDRLAKPENVFRDSMVEGAADLAELIPKMNFTNDPELDRLAGVLRDKLAAHKPDVLRHNSTVRAEAAQAAQSVVRDIGSIFGG